MDAFLIVPAVTRDCADRAGYLVEPGAGLTGIVFIVAGPLRGDDLAGIGIHAGVQFPPRPARPGAVLLPRALARTTQAQAMAVHQQVHGLRLAAIIGTGQPVRFLRSPAA